MFWRSLSLMVTALCFALPVNLCAENVVIPQSVAQRHGLTRAWHTQIELDRSVDHVAYITQQGGILYVQTNHAMVHALDSETGKKIWSAQIGRGNQMSLAPGVNDDLLAVINGSTLFVVDRKNGRLKYDRQLVGAPGAGPALSKKRLYVGMVDGLLQGFNLEDRKELPWVYKSSGRILIQPVITEGSLAWTTDKGHFLVADSNTAKVRFRVETQAPIDSRPAHWTPYLYACSLDGYVYAVNEVTGKTVWKFSSGFAISRQPAAIGNHVFIVPNSDEMFCLDGKTGQELWDAAGIVQFLSVSPTRVYAVDHLNRLTTLDLKTGSRLDTLPLGDIRLKLINQQTDRIYLASNNGIVQCLHEAGLATPLVYTPPPLEKKGAAKLEKPKATEEPADSEGFGDDEAPKSKKPAVKKPAGDNAEEGMEAEPAEEDPFGESK